jgi:Dolichyl-phosphate-mannose-protein mannosyltransferase
MSVLARSRTTVADLKLRSASSPLFTVRLLLGVARFAESYGWLVFAATSLGCGWGYLNNLASRHLDHDELFTFYIAQAPNLRQLFKLTHTIDLHPPLSYLLVRASFTIFGVSSWSCRLPFVLAYFVAVALLFFFLSRLFSPVYGLIATLFLWSNPLARLSNEARPYSMLLCFTTLMLVSWYLAAEGEDGTSRRWALVTVTASGFCLLLSHVLGVLAYATFFGAELLRLWIRRKPDWRLWVALTIPLVSVLTYVPLIRNRSAMLFAEEFRVTPLRLASFYWESIRYVLTPLAVIAFVALLWPLLRKQTPTSLPANTRAIWAPLGFLLASLSFVPLATGILFARNGTAFFDRYGIVWLIPLAAVPAIILGYRTQRDRLAGTAIALLSVTVFFFNSSGKPWLVEQLSSLVPARAAARVLYVLSLPPIIPAHNPPVPSYLRAELATALQVPNLDSVAPELPLVANTGLTFLELDRQERAPVAQRLYLLTDEESAAAIAHDNVFAHYELVKAAFPIRGKVEPYCTFVSAHPRFVVVGAYDNPQGWLLRKLEQDGAKLRVIGTCSGNTEDCQIYEISVRRGQCQSPGEPYKTIVK